VIQVLVPDSSPQGLSWTYELDLGQLLAAVGATQLGPADDEDAAAEEFAADGTAVDRTVAVPGPAAAAFVSGTDVRELSEWDLPGVASAYHRLAAWAHAGELQAVAEMASRDATRDNHVQVDADGRPDQVTPAAGSAVGLELVMSHPTAMDWAHLGVTLRWKLPATWAALNAGLIDLPRAKLIAEATAPLGDDLARKVEAKILRGAGDQTLGQLRASLRRAVIAADPEGAEQRRKNAQRHAKVNLYPDPADGTATLTGTRLPAVHAAAVMARLTAIARAMKSAGQKGGLDYLRATAFIGLLLGTLPLTPPPEGDPGPDGPTDPDPGPSDSDDAGDPGPGPGDSRDPDSGPADPGRILSPSDPADADPGSDPDCSPRGPTGPGPSDPADPAPGPEGSSDPGAARPDSGDRDHGGSSDHCDPPDDWPEPPDPDPRDHPGRRDPGYGDDADWDDDDGPFGPGPPAAWPPIPATVTQTPPFLGQPPLDHPVSHSPPSHPPPRHARPGRRPPPRGQPSRPPPGLLDLVISWRAFTGDPAGPATLSRIGPITAGQALPLALTAAFDPHARWQVIITNADGHAIAVETVRRRHRQSRTRRPAGVTGIVAVTIPAATLDQLATRASSADRGIRAAVLRAARRAYARAQRQAEADADAPGGCAHTMATPGYRPASKLRDYINARDQTCRHPRCRQPARHTDLDHTTPWHKGGLTCSCNIGPHCRTHHQIKQLPGWTLIQTKPGHFQLTTPAGRIYTTTPDPYPA
jgi:hypothetical protein